MSFIIAAALGAESAVSQTGGAGKEFTNIDTSLVGRGGDFAPAALLGDRSTTVILKLNGASVGQRAAEARRQEGSSPTQSAPESAAS